MFVFALPLLAGCKPPPDAPAELDELVGYLFENVPGDDPAPLEVGAANLHDWLDKRIDETLEGYTVDNLSEDAVSALGDGDRDLDGLAGAAVGHVSPETPETLVSSIIEDDPLQVYEGTYLSFDRDYQSGSNCFAKDTCDWLEAEVHASFAYPLGLEVETHSWVQYRWVETDLGPVYVERTWLREPATVSLDFLEVDQQYYLRMILPDDDGGGSRSIQVTWVVARLTGDDVPEDVALGLMIDSMANQADTLDAWIAGE
mgnify:CR=1 FL=1|jgi:hypothetical protein